MGEIPTHILTPDKHHWYDQMIRKGFAERNESYFSLYLQGNPSEIFRQTLLAAGGENARILDIGCGPGKYTEMLTSGYSQVVGLDLSANSLAYGRQHRQAPNLQFILGDSRQLPFGDETFEVAATRLSPNDPAEILRILKSGGLALCMRVGETDALELRKLFGQTGLVEKMERYIARAEPHSQHIAEQWKELGFIDVESTEYEYDMYFDTVSELAKYLSRIPIIPEFDMENSGHMQKLQEYAEQYSDQETSAVILHRHRNIIKGSKQ